MVGFVPQSFLDPPLAPHHEFSFGPIGSTNVRETQEVERLGFGHFRGKRVELTSPKRRTPAK
jgi:hypothetical protein